MITPGDEVRFPEISVVDLSGRIRKQAIAVGGNVVRLDPVPGGGQRAFDALDPIRRRRFMWRA
jgi:hypothetical protein